MNLLKKQGFYNTILLYFGTALGFFNAIILFQRYLTLEEIGFFQLLIAISVLYAQIASLGVNNIILRYFPYYKTEDKKHGGFLNFIFLFSGISFLVFTILFVLFKTPIVNQYYGKDGYDLLTRYYYYLIPVSFFTMAYTILESLARAVFKNVLSAFLKEVLLRVFTSVSVLLIAAKLMDYRGFMGIYLAANALIAGILYYSIYSGKHFSFSALSDEVKNNSRDMIKYGFFAVLSGGSFALVQNLDMIMLSTMTVQSLAYVGIYGTFFTIAVIINMPAKALNRTSYQIISDAWKDNNFEKIAKIYHKTSVVQSLIGGLLLVGLIINKHHIIYLLHKPEYQNYFHVFIIVGIGFFIDITGGLNSHIINSSKYYKWVTMILVLAVILVVLLNLILIPAVGMVGAAISYTVTTFIINFAYWLFIKLKFNMQPFDKMHIYILGISAIALIIGLKLPAISNYYFDLLYRSTIVLLVYCSLAYLLKISEDINEVFDNLFSKIKLR
ncbi:MAG: lipopolysaccharide biosynthesis protein [Mucilaginibacter sp.]|nr:lipopolysaccharide biosynthesis protein [Mucilaginibacter sp.]